MIDLASDELVDHRLVAANVNRCPHDNTLDPSPVNGSCAGRGEVDELSVQALLTKIISPLS
jgi:hypothetical protein